MTDYNPIAAKYAEDVLSGRQIAGKHIISAVKRHLSDLETGKDRGLWFDHDAGQRVIDFTEQLRHWKGSKAGSPILLEPNQIFYLYTLFGWMRDNGTRRFRKSYKEIARKNGKTTECAAKGMYTAYLDNEPGAQVYFVATKEEQARIGFKDVQEIIKKTPGLGSIFHSWTKSVTCEEESSFLKPLGSDSDTQDGFDPHHAIIDEYHAHKTDGMLNVMESGMGARRQPLIDIITTAGFDKQLPCYSFRKVMVDILDGRLTDDALFGMIFTIDEADDWRDESVWMKANPNLHASVYLDNLRDMAQAARNEGGEKEVNFRTKNLNEWTDAAETWISDDVWMQGATSFKSDSLQGATCYGGLDLAMVGDFSALALNFPMPDGSFKRLYRFWIPEWTVEQRVKRGLSNLRNWIEAGYVTVTDGNVTDFDVIEQDILAMAERFNIVSIGADRNYASQLINNLIAKGVNVTPFNQGRVNMTPPTNEYERLIRKGQIDHGKNPVMRWMLGNVVLIKDSNGNVRPDKSKSSDKIDGVVADIMAQGEYITFMNGNETNYDDHYATYGIRSI